MAISLSSAAKVCSLNPEPPFAASSNSAAKLSSLSSLQFPRELRRFHVGNRAVQSGQPSRTLHVMDFTCRGSNSSLWNKLVMEKPSEKATVVKAKKQTFSSFDDLLKTADKPVLVDFYATWCGPCQFMVPVLNEVSTRMKDKIQVVKIDTEKYPSIADKYRIQALPTFIIFKDGEPHDRFEGALTADQLIQQIESSLKVKQ
ncbi:uncharacterized protein [Coffea arabica]|uniref:Thioredoxin domain-containing protein n=1 Tax=Coffea arabica TaxID=13443 RepID=A0A6P6UU30_COFAR|nr:thioredoxin Y2, chloroplastic-like [Coffea arabica]